MAGDDRAQLFVRCSAPYSSIEIQIPWLLISVSEILRKIIFQDPRHCTCNGSFGGISGRAWNTANRNKNKAIDVEFHFVWTLNGGSPEP